MDKIARLSEKCPFAAKSRTKTIRGVTKQEMVELIHAWDDSYDVIVITPSWGWFGFYKWCMKSMEWMSEIDLTAVPDAQNKIILLQRLS